MSGLFAELDHSYTPLGELILRRRRYIGLNTEVYEVKLGDDFLMSSLFTASEEALGRLGVQYALRSCGGAALDVVVGGLGLGYTAAAVLENRAVRSLLVVEYLNPVITWHQKGMLPLSDSLVGDARCRIVQADFFSCAQSEIGFDATQPGRQFDAVLVDIDHTPQSWLAPDNQSFYEVEGLRALNRHLRPGGIFGLWSDDPPDDGFRQRMVSAFAMESAEMIRFHNPLQDTEVTQTVYLGMRAKSLDVSLRQAD